MTIAMLKTSAETDTPGPGTSKRRARQIVAALTLLLLALWTIGSLRYAWHSGQEAAVALLLTAMLVALGIWQLLHQDPSREAAYGRSLWVLLLAEFLPEHLSNSHTLAAHAVPALCAVVWLVGTFLFSRSRSSAAAVLAPDHRSLISAETPLHRPARHLLESAADAVARNVGPILICFVFLYFAAVTALAIAKLRSFGYIGQDVAYFMQCLHTGLNHHIFWSNQYHDLLYSSTVYSDFAGHNQPVLFLLLPLYRLFPHAETLFASRNILLAAAAYPAFRLCRHAVPPLPSMLLTMAYLLTPAILFQNFYDYAPLSLVAVPLLFALLLFVERRFSLYLAALVCCLLVREDLVFVLFGLGLVAWWQRRSRRWALVPICLATAWSLLTWRWLMPYFQQGAVSAVQSCFAYLGATPAAMLHTAFLHPSLLLTHNVVVYLKQIFTPFGTLLPAFSPVSLIAAPYLLINTLGDRGCNAAIVFRHYALIPSILLLPGVPRAVATLKSRTGEFRFTASEVSSFVLLSSVTTTLLAIGPAELGWWHPAAWQAEARSVASMLPPDAAVAVPRYMLPLVANRDSVYQSPKLLQYHHPEAEYVVIDRDDRRGGAQGSDAYAVLKAELRNEDRFRAIYTSENYIVYHRTGPPLVPLTASGSPGRE
jgi:uncharacterized membrane protein